MEHISSGPRTGIRRQKTNSSKKGDIVTRRHRVDGASLGKGAERNSWQAKVAAGLKFQVPEAKRAAEIRYLDRKMGQPVWKGGKNLVKF